MNLCQPRSRRRLDCRRRKTAWKLRHSQKLCFASEFKALRHHLAANGVDISRMNEKKMMVMIPPDRRDRILDAKAKATSAR